MNTFYLVRHGETENNRAKRLSGWIDTPLTELGLVPTQRVIQKLNETSINAIYSSDLGRAFTTAYEIARKRNFTKEIIRLAGLREVNYGDAANMFSKDTYKLYPQLDRDTHYTPPNGESLADMQARVMLTLFDINALHHGENILLVAHSGVMAAIRSFQTGEDFGKHNISEAYEHDFVARVKVADGKVTLFEPVNL